MIWIYILGGVFGAVFIFGLLFAALLALGTLAKVQSANKVLAEQLLDAREKLKLALIPINMSVSDDQIDRLAFAINNVRNTMQVPGKDHTC